MSSDRARDDAAWWREGVLYQIYPRSFQDSNGDGIGDLRGIRQRLDHLAGGPASLGVDGIWISPFYPSPMADFGYDISDFCDVDSVFGTLDDFDELAAAAHDRGIRIVIDLVPNHTSDRHPWFVESRRGRTNPKRDWYVWADPKPDGSPPNNWRSAFPRGQVSAWTLDRTTGQFYLHSFLPQQPDLNWWNPAVRDAFDNILRFWLDRGVDGFRIDVAHGMAFDPALGDNPETILPPSEHQVSWADDAAPHDRDWPEVHEILRRFRRTVDAYPGRMLVGEVYLLDPARLARYYGAADDELNLAFNFAFLRAPWSAAAFRTEIERFESVLPAHGWPDYTLSNHDHPRHVSRYAPGGDLARGRRRGRLAALMLLTLRGTPFLYNGEEIGMADGPVPSDRIVDVDGRDPERTPLQWEPGPGAGFTTGRPWLPIGPEAATVNVAAQRGDSRSMLSLYRQLIRRRRASPALRGGSQRLLDGLPETALGYVRRAGDDAWLVLLNFGTEATAVETAGLGLGPAGSAGVAMSTDPDRLVGGALGARVELGPEEGILVELPAAPDDSR